MKLPVAGHETPLSQYADELIDAVQVDSQDSGWLNKKELREYVARLEAIVGDLAASDPFSRDNYSNDWDCLVCPANGTDMKSIERDGIKEVHWAECAWRRAVEAKR
jgi:hypothetical protein